MLRPSVQPAGLTGDSVSRSRDRVNKENSDWSKSKQRPLYQDNVTDAELEEEIPRKLESVNPLAPRSLVHFSYLKGEFEAAAPASPTIHLMHLESAALLKTSPEILEFDDTFDFNDSSAPKKDQGPAAQDEADDSTVADAATEEPGATDEDTEDKDAETVRAIYMAARTHRERKVPNAFNFCEEASQTFNPITRSAEAETSPPLRGRCSLMISLSIIYDAYAADFAKQEKAKKSLALPKQVKEKIDEAIPEKADAFKLTERVVCQNIFDGVASDFRYFEDPADQFRSEGRLLPLWRFSLPNQLIPVTDMEWSSDYYDLLAVSFGDFDFKTVERLGAVGMYSLKNPLHPEYLRQTDAPALALSLHPVQTNLMAVGLYDGHVAVFNCARPEPGPQFISDSDSKHVTGVYAVVWRNGAQLNFYSISADGFVKSWVLMPTSLEATVVRTIGMPTRVRTIGMPAGVRTIGMPAGVRTIGMPAGVRTIGMPAGVRTIGMPAGVRTIGMPAGVALTGGPEGAALKVRGCGFRMKFHPLEEHVYLIGTSEGLIMKCSILHSKDYLFLYHAHHLPVNCVNYNPFNPSIFLSCSADWTVKVWQDERSEPLLVFNLQHAVADVEWAPYTSTVFAAATFDGWIHVFDLNMSRYQPIHKQHAVSSLLDNTPTRLCFNNATPVLVVGDKRGRVTALKFSPNLRIPAKASKKEIVEQKELEERKLIRVLSFMKPRILEAQPDIPSIPD